MPRFGSILSTSTRLKMSDQVSSRGDADARLPGSVGQAVAVADAGEKVDAGVAGEGVGDRQPLGVRKGVGRPRRAR